jgi:hypothetical protein
LCSCACGAQLHNVSAIDVVSHTFTADIFYEASWTDHAVVRDWRTEEWESQPYEHDSNNDKLWTPRLRIRNLVESAEQGGDNNQEWFEVFNDTSAKPSKAKRGASGASAFVICQRKRLFGTFSEHMELRNFPWDAQDLTFELVSDIDISQAGGGGGMARLQLNPKWRSFACMGEDFLLRDEYELCPAVLAFESLTRPCYSGSLRQYPLLLVCFKVVRQDHFYWNTILEPLAIFVALSFCSLILEPSALADRLSVTLSMVLTAAAYKLVCAEHLPKVSYDTALGKFVRYCFRIIGAVAVLNCLSYMLTVSWCPADSWCADWITCGGWLDAAAAWLAGEPAFKVTDVWWFPQIVARLLLPDAAACIGPLVACWWVRRGPGKGSVVRTFLCESEPGGPGKTEIERRHHPVHYFCEGSPESKRNPQRFLKGSGGRSLTYTVSCIDPSHNSHSGMLDHAVGGASHA